MTYSMWLMATCKLKESIMFGIGIPELILILVICLLVFGAAKLPEIGRNLGKAIGEFKKGMKDNEITDKKDEAH